MSLMSFKRNFSCEFHHTRADTAFELEIFAMMNFMTFQELRFPKCSITADKFALILEKTRMLLPAMIVERIDLIEVHVTSDASRSSTHFNVMKVFQVIFQSVFNTIYSRATGHLTLVLLCMLIVDISLLHTCLGCCTDSRSTFILVRSKLLENTTTACLMRSQLSQSEKWRRTVCTAEF